MSNKLCDGSEMREHYGIPVYGEFPRYRARRHGKGLDKLFERWEFGHANTDERSIANSIAALIRERHDGKRVLLLGTASQEALEGLKAKLQPLLPTVSLDVQANFLTNPNAIAAAADADAVLLVEEKYASSVNDVERAVEMLMIGSVNADGCVLV